MKYSLKPIHTLLSTLPLLLTLYSLLHLSACHNTGGKTDSGNIKADTTAFAQCLDSAIVLNDSSRWEESLSMAKQALAIARALKDTVGIGDALSTIVSDYHHTGKIDSAIISSKEILELDKPTGDAELLSSDYNNIAAIYLGNKNYKLAKEFIDMGIAMEEKVEGQPKMAIRYGIAAETYNKLAGDTTEAAAIALRQQALAFISKAYDLDMAKGDTLRAGRRLSVRGDVLVGMKQTAKAEQTYLAAIAMLSGVGEHHSYAITCRELGTLYLAQGKREKAIAYLEKATGIAKEEGEKNTLVKDYQQLHEAYKDIDEAKSTEYLVLYTQTKDSLYSMESAKSLSEFHARYETDKEKERAEQKNRHLMIVISVCILLVLLAVVLYCLLRRRNRKNIQLQEQNIKLEEQMNQQRQEYLNIIEQMEKDNSTAMNNADKSFLDSVNNAIFELMDGNEVSADNVSEKLCITPQQLRRKLQTIKNVTAIAYINSVRIGYAKKLVSERRDITIAEIARQCGFDEPTTFTRFFKKETGMTPTQYRES